MYLIYSEVCFIHINVFKYILSIFNMYLYTYIFILMYFNKYKLLWSKTPRYLPCFFLEIHSFQEIYVSTTLVIINKNPRTRMWFRDTQSLQLFPNRRSQCISCGFHSWLPENILNYEWKTLGDIFFFGTQTLQIPPTWLLMKVALSF